MANEITFQQQMVLNNGSLKDQHSSGSIAVDQTTAALMRNVQTVPTTAGGTALDIGSLTTPGFASFINLDATNYIEIGINVAATFHPTAKLKPGEQAMFRLATTAPYAIADTASVKLFYVIYED